MASVDVKTIENKSAGSMELPGAVFEVTVKPDLFHAEVRRQLAARRAGTHSTKNRHAVSGGGSKPWKQKGTGRARQGTNRAPQWAGGGVVFGPVPRSYEHALPKKVRRAALRGALTMRRKEDAITVVDDFSVDEFKTKRVVEMLTSLGIADQKVLIVTAAPDEKLRGSVNNLHHVTVLPVAGLNVFDVLRHGRLLLTRDAVEGIDLRLSEERRKAAKQEGA